MCNPLLAVAIIGTAISAYGTYQAGKTQADYAKYEAKQMEADARAEQGAALVEAARIRRAKIFAQAEATAAIAGSGIDVASPGALNINRDIGKRAEEDAYLAIVGGKDRAARMKAQAAVTRAGGVAAKQAGTLGAASALLQGAQQGYSAWKLGKNPVAGTG